MNRILGDELVVLYVDPDRKKFIVHRKPFVQAVSILQKSLHTRLQRTLQNEMDMPEDDEDAVASLVTFIYNGYATLLEIGEDDNDFCCES